MAIDLVSGFRLGPWEVYPREGRLTGSGGERHLEPRVMDVLVAFAERPGEVLSKEELIAAVWGDTHVGDEALSNAVWQLRSALGDDARQPRFIGTVPRRGYRLVESVGPLGEEAQQRHRWLLVGAAAAALLLTILAWNVASRRSGPRRIRSVAVLPFESLSPEPRAQRLASGLTDQLIAALSGLEGLEVTSRSSVEHYDDASEPLPDIARELGVDAVLESTVVTDQGRVRVTTQLIEGATDHHLWAQTYERDVTDLFELQADLARIIALQLGRRLSRPEGEEVAALDEHDAPAVESGGGIWRFRTDDEIWSTPRIIDGVAYFGSDDHSVYAVDLAARSQLWSFQAEAPVRGRPTAVGSRLYVTSVGSRLYAIDRTSGKQLWSVDVAAESAPAVAGGRAFVGARDGLVAFDAENGRRLWRLPTNDYVVATPLVRGRDVLAGSRDGQLYAVAAADGREHWRFTTGGKISSAVVAAGDTVYVSSEDHYLYAIDADAGRELWREDLGAFPVTSPTAAHGAVYVGTDDGRLHAIDARQGHSLWSFTAGDSPSSDPRVFDGVVYFGCADDHLYAVDALSGEPLWRLRTDSWITSSPDVVDGRIVFGGVDGYLWVVNERGAPTFAQPLGAQPVSASRFEIVGGDASTLPQLLWRYEVGTAIYASPTLAGGAVYVGGDARLHAVDATTGEELWRFATGGDIDSSPAVSGGVAYFGSRDGNVYAVTADGGNEVWRFATGDDVVSSPAVAGGTVFVGSQDGRLYALDAASGAERWAVVTGGNVNSSPMVDHDNVYFGSCDRHLYAVDRTRGDIRWRFDTGECLVASPLVYDGAVLIGGSEVDHGDLFAVDVDTGRERWRFPTAGDIWYRPTAAGGSVYVGSGDYHVYALDAATGNELWRFRTGNRALTSPVLLPGLLLFGSHDRNLYAVDPRRGRELWRIQIGRTVHNVTVGDNRAYFGGADGILYAIRLPDGAEGASRPAGH